MNRVLAAGETNLTPKRTAVLHAWVPAEVAARLSKIAEKRGVHVDRLTADILIGADDLYAVAEILDR